MRRTATPPTAQQLRDTQTRLGLKDVALWLMALPIGVDLFAVGYSWGCYTYRQASVTADDYESPCDVVAALIGKGHTGSDTYLHLDSVSAPHELLRVVSDGVVTSVVGARALWPTGIPVCSSDNVPPRTLRNISQLLSSDNCGEARDGVFVVDGQVWLITGNGSGVRVHATRSAVKPHNVTSDGFQRWARRISTLVGLPVGIVDPDTLTVVLDPGGVPVVVQAQQAHNGQYLTAVPDDWNFELAPNAPIPEGWHVMGVQRTSGQVVVQHSTTGICALLG